MRAAVVFFFPHHDCSTLILNVVCIIFFVPTQQIVEFAFEVEIVSRHLNGI